MTLSGFHSRQQFTFTECVSYSEPFSGLCLRRYICKFRMIMAIMLCYSPPVYHIFVWCFISYSLRSPIWISAFATASASYLPPSICADASRYWFSPSSLYASFFKSFGRHYASISQARLCIAYFRSATDDRQLRICYAIRRYLFILLWRDDASS